MDYESQVPYDSYAVADIAFERMDTVDPDAIVDPLDAYPLEEIAEDIFFVAGFIPVVGTFIDIADAVISLAEGDYTNAVLSAIFAFIDIRDLYRLADRMAGLTDQAEAMLRRLPDDAAEFRQAHQNQIDTVHLKNQRLREATDQIKFRLGERIGWVAPVFRHNAPIYYLDISRRASRATAEEIRTLFENSGLPHTRAGFEEFMLQYRWRARNFKHGLVPDVDSFAVESIEGLEIAERYYEGIPVEIGAIFDGDRLLYIAVGDVRIEPRRANTNRDSYNASIGFPAQVVPQLKGNTFTHYHFTGGPLSRSDIATTLDTQLGEIRAVGPVYTYSYTPSVSLRNYIQSLPEEDKLTAIQNISSEFARQQDELLFSRIYYEKGLNLRTTVQGDPADKIIGDSVLIREPFANLQSTYVISIHYDELTFSETLHLIPSNTGGID